MQAGSGESKLCAQPACPYYPTALGLCSEHVLPLTTDGAKLSYFRTGMPELQTWGPTQKLLLTPLWGIVGEYVGFATNREHNALVRLTQRPPVIGVKDLEAKVKRFVLEEAPSTLVNLVRIVTNPAVLLNMMVSRKWLLSSSVAVSLYRIAEGRFRNSERDVYLWGSVIFCRVWCRDGKHLGGVGHCCSLHQELRQPYTMSDPDEYVPNIGYYEDEWVRYLNQAQPVVAAGGRNEPIVID